MKKRFTLFVVASMLFALNMSAQETEVYVTTKAEFTTAFNAHPGTPGSVTKIIIAAGKNDDGTYAQATSDFTLNVGNFTPEATACADGTIIITSNQTDIDNLPHVPLGLNMSAQAADSHFSLVIENVSFEYRAGNLATSGQIVYWNKADCHADSIVFRNCQLTNIPRTLIRTVPAQTDGVYNSDNTLNRFVMEGCKVHDMELTSGNTWPIVYLATQTDEVVFRNNMFYNIPYAKQILTWNYCEPTGKEVHVTFENNLVVAAKGTWKGFDGNEASGPFSMIDVGGFLGSMTSYDINNNIILTPEVGVEYTAWGNVSQKGGITLTEAQESKILGCTGGMVFAANNVIEGYAAWTAGNNKTEDGDRTWLIGPVGSEAQVEDGGEGRIDMATAGLAWTDFYDAHSADFRLEKSHALFAQNIGPSIMYVDKFPVKASLSVSVEGPSYIDYTVSPNKENYEVGDVVTITVNDHNSKYRTFNTFKGWNDGNMDNPRTVTLDGAVELTATYEDATTGLVSAFTFPTVPAAGQNKLSSYDADIFAEGYQASVSQMIVPDVTDEEGNVIGVEDAYRQVDGSENRFNYRAVKFGEDPASDQMAVISRKSTAAARAAGMPDYFIFTFPAKDLTDITFSAFVGTDNFGYKKQLADYSLDGNTWTNFASVELEKRDADFSGTAGQLYGWNELVGTLPAEANNQETVYVRIIGDINAEDKFVTNTAAGEIDTETAGMFEYCGNVMITASKVDDGITFVNNDESGDNAIYNLMGMKVGNTSKGIVIKNGKKFVVK